MKKLISAVTLLLTVFMLVPSCMCVASASAADNFHNGWDGNIENSFFSDSTGYFSDSEIEEIDSRVKETARSLEMNIIIFAAGPAYYMSDSETESFTDTEYDSICGGYTDGVLYFMDFTGKKPAYDYISTSGKAVLMYQNNIDSILNATWKYLPPSSVEDYSEYTDDIKQAVFCFLSQLSDPGPAKRNYHDSKNNKYYYKKDGKLVITDKKPFIFSVKALFFGLLAGGLTALIYYFSVKSTYKFKASLNPSAYVSHEHSRFIVRHDKFMRTFVTRTRIDTDSGGRSSGGGGGGGGGGGSHGGGGGHR